MKVNKADQPKVVALSILLVAIVGALVYQFMSFQAPTDTPIATAPPSVVAAADPKPEPGGFESIIPPSGPGVSNPNPFRRVLREEGTSTGEIPIKKVPEQELGIMPKPADPSTDPGISIKEPDLPKLTGVLLGDRPVAVFEQGGRSFVAGLGQTIAGGFVVRQIGEKEAQISYAGKVHRLKLGD